MDGRELHAARGRTLYTVHSLVSKYVLTNKDVTVSKTYGMIISGYQVHSAVFILVFKKKDKSRLGKMLLINIQFFP